LEDDRAMLLAKLNLGAVEEISFKNKAAIKTAEGSK
jgi:hypothetical protein